MKVTSTHLAPPPPKFTPVRLTIDIETPEELMAFFNIGNHNISTAKLVAGKGCGGLTGATTTVKADPSCWHISNLIGEAFFHGLKDHVRAL